MFAELISRLLPILERVELLLPKKPNAVNFARHNAAKWHNDKKGGFLEEINYQNNVNLEDLQGLDSQKKVLKQNTLQFLLGIPANHALLWGARGTGKSTLVRSLLIEYQSFGLRLIEIDAEHLIDLPDILKLLKSQQYYFIIFCDDLAFESKLSDYRTLKSVLDGSLTYAPDNVIIYATSNRRHLLPEYQAENQTYENINGEIHASDSVEEKIALSDRFGIWLGFYSFTQEQYMLVVKQWLSKYAASWNMQIEIDSEQIKTEAIRWATYKGNRNGRAANQFAKHWLGIQKIQSLDADLHTQDLIKLRSIIKTK